jgi:hypothetical protein
MPEHPDSHPPVVSGSDSLLEVSSGPLVGSVVGPDIEAELDAVVSTDVAEVIALVVDVPAEPVSGSPSPPLSDSLKQPPTIPSTSTGRRVRTIRISLATARRPGGKIPCLDYASARKCSRARYFPPSPLKSSFFILLAR